MTEATQGGRAREDLTLPILFSQHLSHCSPPFWGAWQFDPGSSLNSPGVLCPHSPANGHPDGLSQANSSATTAGIENLWQGFGCFSHLATSKISTRGRASPSMLKLRALGFHHQCPQSLETTDSGLGSVLIRDSVRHQAFLSCASPWPQAWSRLPGLTSTILISWRSPPAVPFCGLKGLLAQFPVLPHRALLL